MSSCGMSRVWNECARQPGVDWNSWRVYVQGWTIMIREPARDMCQFGTMLTTDIQGVVYTLACDRFSS